MKKLMLAIVAVAAMVFGANADGYAFDKSVNFKITYEGAAVNDFPLLLKLDTTKVPDLYDTVVNSGADLQFTSLDGGTEYPYEVDTWNPAGTSLVWVKVPRFEKDAKFKMNYGCAEKTTNPGSTAVWSAYAGVWHLNAALDSSGKDLDTDGTTHTTKFFGSPACSVTDAPIGLGYGQSASLTSPAFASKVYDNRNGYKKPMQVSNPNRLSVVCWHRPTIAFSNWGTDYKWKTLFGPRNTGNNSWGATWCGDASKPQLRVENKNGSDGVTRKAYGVPVKPNEWYQFAVVYNGSEQKIYLNGNLLSTATGLCDDLAWSWTGWMGWGGCVDNTGGAIASESCAGDFDECRIYDGIVDATRVAADYAVVKNDYCETVSAEDPFVTIDSLTYELESEYVPTTLKLEAVATLHNGSGTLVYHWDLNDDGKYDDVEGEDKASIEVELNESARFTPGVMVTVEGTELFARESIKSQIDVRERSILLSLDVSPTVVDVPATVTFSATATRDGIEGEITYIWKTNDVEIARTLEPAYQFEYSEVSSFVPSVTVVVDGSGYTTSAVGPEVLAVASYYVDSEAEAGGNGTQGSPFNDLSDALDMLTSAKAIYMKGSLTLPKDGVMFSRDGFVFAKWGDEADPMPVLSCEAGDKAPASGVFNITGQNVVFSGIAFKYPASLHDGAKQLICIYANGARISNCEFELTSLPTKACSDGSVVKSDNKIAWTADNCSFKGYGIEGDYAYRVFSVAGGIRVENSRFEDCSNIFFFNNSPWEGVGVSFVSNFVHNSKATMSSGANAGTVAVCDSWKFCQGLTIAHNVLVNDASRKAGCVATIRGTSHPFQNYPLAVYNNTVVGYDAVVEVDSLTLVDSPNNRKTVLQVFNNLCNGAIPLYTDNQNSWQLKENASFIRNNARTDGSVYLVPNYTLTDHATVVDNVMVSAIKFRSTNPASPDFYRPKVMDKRDVLMVGGWTDNGKYPAYIGAVEPLVTGGLILYIR